MRRVLRWMGSGLLVFFLLASATAQAEERVAPSQSLTLSAGPVSARQMDRGFSPLIFSGVQGAVEVTYSRELEGRERSWRLGVSSGALQNRHGRNLRPLTVSVLMVSLFPLSEESPFQLGWSKDNQFNFRTIDDFGNFFFRSDGFTSFGPAAKYSLGFDLFGQEFSFEVLSHVQLLGFYIPSGYVSSLPSGFGYESGGFVRSAFASAFLFYPGSAIGLGIRPELQWNWGGESSLAFSYNYDFVSLRNIHRSRRSQGDFLLSLRVEL